MDNYLPLLQAFDPLFPVGAYTLSGGLETYTQEGLVRDRESLSRYLAAYIAVLPYGDLGFAAHAARGGEVAALDALCHAAKAPSEVRSGSIRLGASFIKTLTALYPCTGLDAYAELICAGTCHGHYPVAAGVFTRDTGAETARGLEIFCYSLLAAAVNHAAKLVPLRQRDAQGALAEAVGLIPAAVELAMGAEPDELGVSGAGFDLRAMRHETLYTRLYAS
jgi:urease accessory protein